MSGNTIGNLFTVTSCGESHGYGYLCIVDGCPPGMELAETDLQHDLDRRKPGKSRHVTQRRESDKVKNPVRRVRREDNGDAYRAAD